MKESTKTRVSRPFLGKSEELYGVSNHMGTNLKTKTFLVSVYFCWIKIASYIDDRQYT